MELNEIARIAEKIEQAENVAETEKPEHAEKSRSTISTEDRANVLIQALPYIQKWAGTPCSARN